MFKAFIYTSFIQLQSTYHNRPMAVHVYSYEAPKVIVQNNKLTLYLYAHALFKVKADNAEINNVFSLKLVSVYVI